MLAPPDQPLIVLGVLRRGNSCRGRGDRGDQLVDDLGDTRRDNRETRHRQALKTAASRSLSQADQDRETLRLACPLVHTVLVRAI